MQAESTPGALYRRRSHRSPAETRAFEAFHVGFFVPLAAYCMADLHDWHAAEELADDALMVLWRNWAHLHAHDHARCGPTPSLRFRQMFMRSSCFAAQGFSSVALRWGEHVIWHILYGNFVYAAVFPT